MALQKRNTKTLITISAQAHKKQRLNSQELHKFISQETVPLKLNTEERASKFTGEFKRKKRLCLQG